MSEQHRDHLYDIDAEQAVLGACLIDGEAVYNIANILKAGDFYEGKHQIIYNAMQTVAQSGRELDVLTLQSELERTNNLGKVGGTSAISELLTVVPSALNAMSYAGIVTDYASRRDILRTAHNLVKGVYRLEDKTDDTITRAMQQLQAHGRGGEIVSAKDVIKQLHDEFTNYVDAPLASGEVRGIDTGWKDLNAYLGGWKPGFYVVLGEPHVGKSWFVLTAAMNVARQGQRVLLFSLEMRAMQLVRRLCLQHAGITQHNYDIGRVTKEQASKFAEMEGEIADWNLDIADDMSSASEIFSTIHREMRSDNPPALIAIDYLGLIETTFDRESTNWEMIALTRTLKNMGRQLQVPIIAPHQISDKAVQMRSNKRPMISDGYGSGGISQDADIVLGLYQPFKYGEGQEHTMWVFVLKDRLSGSANPNNPVELIFTQTGALLDAAKGYDYDDHYANTM